MSINLVHRAFWWVWAYMPLGSVKKNKTKQRYKRTESLTRRGRALERNCEQVKSESEMMRSFLQVVVGLEIVCSSRLSSVLCKR